MARHKTICADICSPGLLRRRRKSQSTHGSIDLRLNSAQPIDSTPLASYASPHIAARQPDHSCEAFMRPFAAIVLVVFSSALCAAHRLRRPLRNLRLHRRRLLRSRILPQASSSSKVTALFATASTAAAAAARRFASQSSFKLRTMKRSSPSSRTVSLRICRRPGICLRRKSPSSEG